MELGLFVEPQCGGSYDRLLELARWSEGIGLDAFARSDHYLNGDASEPTTDALVSFAGLARETSSIRLVSLVSPITFRHPAVMAKSATTIDEMSGGRFTLGVGTGWMESEHQAFGMDLPPLRERFDRFEESLAMIRAMFNGGGTVRGDHYHLDSDVVSPAASDGLRIVIGGSGMAKTPRLAGTYADEYNSFVNTKDVLDQRIEVMTAAASEAGRNSDDILLSFAGPAFVFDNDTSHRESLAERGAKRNMTADEYAAFLDDRSVPHGTPDRAQEAIDRMSSWGIGCYYVQEYRHLDEINLEQLGVLFSTLQGS